LIDDSPRNLSAGRQLGMYTIQVGHQSHTDAHVQIATIHELPGILPQGFLEA
jgi:FMN phosphatase YigB (HAD superfamily)